MLLLDNTARKVPIARVMVVTPYLKGLVEAQCLPDAIYDLIIGNVPGARPAHEPDPTWQEACAVTTRGQAKKDGEVTTRVPLSINRNLNRCRVKMRVYGSTGTEMMY